MVAAPPIGGQLFGLFQPSGIEVNVADQLQKVSVPVTKNRFVTPLEEMADGSVPPIIT
jgi:hypothetical protein